MTDKTFNDLPISQELRQAVAELGYQEPTPIQIQAIPLIVEGRDITGQSQTGSGKTASFGLPALDLIDLSLPNNIPQVLILCPTRELALQGSSELRKFAKYKKNIHIATIYGGDSYDRQFAQLRMGCQIVVGTPGRIMDHMRRGTLHLNALRMLVLDEADEMLNMGFLEDIETILLEVPAQRQTVMFSATMPPEILELSIKFQKDPRMVRIDQKQLTVSTLEQFYFETPAGRKFDAAVSLLIHAQPNRAIIFCNTKKMVDELVEELISRGFAAQGLHGDLRQTQRTQIMNQYKDGKFAILVATDVAARGIDVDDVEIVLNFDLPLDEEYYVHRIGRTARAGKTGKSFTLIQGKGQFYRLRDIMRYTKSKIEEKPLPSLAEIKESQKQLRLNKVAEVMQEDDYRIYLDEIKDLAATSDADPLEIAAALFHLHFGPPQDLKELANLQVADGDRAFVKRDRRDRVKPQEDKAPSRRKDGRNIGDPDKAVIKISIGKNDRVSAGHILSAIATGSGLPGKLIGAITIQQTFSLVDVPKEHRKAIVKKLNNTKIKGKKVQVL